MVVSGTRNARAISAVVSPPTARSVSATCEGGDSAGWQHRNSSDSVSSVAGAQGTESSADSGTATAASRRRRAVSLRHRSASRLDATVISHPFGLCGMPCFDHAMVASRRASWTASSHASKWPWWRTRAPRTCGASARSVCPMSVALSTYASHLQAGDVHGRADLDALPSCVRDLRGDSGRPVQALAVDQVIADQVFLGLRVWTVGTGEDPV